MAIVDTVATYQYALPKRMGDGLETGHLSSENIDMHFIEKLIDLVIANEYQNIHSILIVRNGKLILEEYFAGWDETGTHQEFTRETFHSQFSATKSVTALLIGIAIDKHLIGGTDEKLSSFFKEYSYIFAEEDKADIRLHHLLSMTAGLAWDESTYPSTDSRNDYFKMCTSIDPIRYVLERQLIAEPGTQFNYSCGLAVILGEIIYRVTGMRADKFAENYLLGPLGISDYYWRKLSNDVIQTASGLSLRPRDMAKIGCLYLNNGQWNGEQLVSKRWIQESRRQQAPTQDRLVRWKVPYFVRRRLKESPIENNEYGYLCWLGTFRIRDHIIESFMAEGKGGQFIIVFPKLNMVVVFTGWNPDKLGNLQPLRILRDYILPGVIYSTKNK